MPDVEAVIERPPCSRCFWRRLPSRSARADEVIDRVLAVVAGDLIMQSDVRAARELGLVNAGDAADPDRAVLSQLIDRALILDEVERYAPPEPAPDAIDRAFRAVRARFASDDGFFQCASRASDSTRNSCGRSFVRTCEFARTSISDLRGRRPSVARRLSRRGWRGFEAAQRSWISTRRTRAAAIAITDYPITSYPIRRALPAGRHELEHLQQIESGVADHRRDHRAASQVHHAPERAEQRGGDDRIDALHEVTRSERQRSPPRRRPFAPPSDRSNRRRRNARCSSSRMPPATTTSPANMSALPGVRIKSCSGLCSTVCSHGATARTASRTSRAMREGDERQRNAGARFRRRTVSRRRTRRRGLSPCARRNSTISPTRNTVSASDNAMTKPKFKPSGPCA